MILVIPLWATGSSAPEAQLSLERATIASCYGEEHRGGIQASGEAFDPDAFTTAHRDLPFGTPVHVRHEDAEIDVVVTDRGPYTDGREFDLSCGAMRSLGLEPGVHPVMVSH
jgi:rare lipoprotein A